MSRNRRGIVLLAALLAIGILSILTIGAIRAISGVRTGAALDERAARLEGGVAHAVSDVVAGWSTSLGDMKVGDVRILSMRAPGVDSVVVAATRITSSLFWVVASARSPDGLTRRANVIIRAPVVDSTLSAPLVAAGDVTLSSGATIVSGDSAGSPCADSALLIASPSAHVSGLGTSDSTHLVRRAWAANPSTYSAIAGSTWARLIAAADVNVPANSTVTPMPTGDCSDGSATDWGDPRGTAAPSCAARRPLIYAAGNLVISSGLGAGVLLVQGTLQITGPWHFAGLVVALGGITSSADDVEIDGTVMSGTAGGVILSHRVTIVGDACGVQSVVKSALPARVISGRGWMLPF